MGGAAAERSAVGGALAAATPVAPSAGAACHPGGMEARPLSAIGEAVLDRLAPGPRERVLDAGAGSPRTSAQLAGMVGTTRLTVVAASRALADAAAAHLPREVELGVQEPEALVLSAPVDAAISVGVLHLVEDVETALRRLASALRPGGRLEATCAGAGNVADVRAALEATLGEEPWASALSGTADPWTTLEPADLEAALGRAGFVDVVCERHEMELRPEHPHAHLRATVLGAHLARLPDAVHGDFVEAVRARMADPDALRFVRLETSARRDPNARPSGILAPGETVPDLARRLGGS